MATLGEIEDAVARRARRRCARRVPAAVRVAVPVAAAHHEPARDPDDGRRVRRAGRPVGPHARHPRRRRRRSRSARSCSRSTSRSTAPAPGPTIRSRSSPNELKELVAHVRDVEAALGDGVKRGPSDEERVEMYAKARRSVVAACAIPAGTRITRDMLTIKRPGHGIAPKFIDALVGRVAGRRHRRRRRPHLGDAVSARVRLVFDEGPGVGLGHRRRMEALARGARRAAATTVVLVPLGRDDRDRPRDVVVVDSYRVRADDRAFARAGVVVAVDDLARDLAVDLVVDPSPGAVGARAPPRAPGARRRGLRARPRPARRRRDRSRRSTAGRARARDHRRGRRRRHRRAASPRRSTPSLPDVEIRLVVGPWGSTRRARRRRSGARARRARGRARPRRRSS